MRDEFAEEGYHPLDLVVEQKKRLEEENRRMREALRPFVNCLERTEVAYTPAQLAHIADGHELLDGITWGDLRRARAALG